MIILILFYICLVKGQTNIQQLLNDNPLLQTMPMFRNSVRQLGREIRRMPTSLVQNITDDDTANNFDDRFKSWNETLFQQAEMEPSDIDFQAIDDIRAEQMKEDDVNYEDNFVTEVMKKEEERMPFAAIESLFETTVSSIDAKMEPTEPEPNQRISEFFEESEFEEVMTRTEQPEISPKSVNMLPQSEFRGSIFAPTETRYTRFGDSDKPLELPIKSDQFRVDRKNGKFSVSSTKYYEDNRVQSTLKSSKFSSSIDPFLVEQEMMKSRVHGTRISPEQPDSNSILLSGDAQDNSPITTNVRIIKRDGKEMERRETMHKGKMAVVEILDKMLYGHDYLHKPGAIINDNLTTDHSRSHRSRKVLGIKQIEQEAIAKADLADIMTPRDRLIFGRKPNKMLVSSTTIEDKQNKDISWRNFAGDVPNLSDKIESECFSTSVDTSATAADPFEMVENGSKLICLRTCAYTWPCTFVTFNENLMRCQLYSQPPSQDWTEKEIGVTLYTPLTDARACVKRIISLTAQHSAKTFIGDYGKALHIVEKNSFEIRKSIIPPIRRCNAQSEVLFVKSSNVSLVRKSDRSQITMSEDDCVFACLTNTKSPGSPIDCVSAEYDTSRGLCDLMTSFPTTVGMSVGPVPVNLYEKICVSREAGELCLGGVTIRQRQKVLIGFLRDAHTTTTASECIELCIVSESKLAFKCLSVMFYPDEISSNCILNEGSAETNPSAMANENQVRVDYFGIDQCFGLTEVTKSIQPPALENSDYKRFKAMKRKALRIVKVANGFFLIYITYSDSLITYISILNTS